MEKENTLSWRDIATKSYITGRCCFDYFFPARIVQAAGITAPRRKLDQARVLVGKSLLFFGPGT